MLSLITDVARILDGGGRGLKGYLKSAGGGDKQIVSSRYVIKARQYNYGIPIIGI